MPAPTTTCSICNQTVLKSQTSHIGGGKRACKTHEGVTESANKIQSDMKAESIKEREMEERRRKERDEKRQDPYGLSDKDKVIMYSSCWNCGIVGLPASIYYQRLLIGMEKMKLKNEKFDLFSNAVAKEAGVLGVPPIRSFNLPVEYEKEIVKNAGSIHHMLPLSIQLMRMVALCPNCCDLYAIDFNPKISLENIMLLSSVFETSELKKTLVSMASKEVVLEKTIEDKVQSKIQEN